MPGSRTIPLIVLITLVVAVTVNAVRLTVAGPSVFMTDFRPVYTACRTFAEGDNPYRDSVLKETWERIAAVERTDEHAPGAPASLFLYPPSSLILWYPYTLLDWRTAKIVHLAGTALFLAAILGMALRGCPSRHAAAAGILLALAWNSNWLGVFIGQPVFFSVTAALAAVALDDRGKRGTAAVCLALAFVKPTTALPFLLYFLVQRRFAVVAWAAAVALALNLLPFAVLPWSALGDYAALVQSAFIPGMSNDYSAANPRFFEMANMHVLLALALPRSAVEVAVVLLIAAAVAWYLLRGRTLPPKQQLVYFAFCSLFFTYHRFSDTIVLAVLFLTTAPDALLRSLRSRILLLVPLLIPWTGLVQRFRDDLPAWLYTAIAPGTAWGLVAAFVLWACACRRYGGRGDGINRRTPSAEAPLCAPPDPCG